MPCIICGNEKITKAFSHKVLKDKYEADYMLCSDCGFLFAPQPHWLAESYTEPIDKTDTGYVARNLSSARRTWPLFAFLFGLKKQYLDYAGGYGMFVRIMRDMGLDFYLEDKYSPNLFVRGFEYKQQTISAVTCFEGFEHFADPMKELNNIFSISKNVFFSTLLIDDAKIPNLDWWYYGFIHGQHASFYSLKTLRYIAKQNNVFLYSNGINLHLFLEKKFSGLIFWLLLKLGFLPWDYLSKFVTKGKTWSDHLYMRNNL